MSDKRTTTIDLATARRAIGHLDRLPRCRQDAECWKLRCELASLATILDGDHALASLSWRVDGLSPRQRQWLEDARVLPHERAAIRQADAEKLWELLRQRFDDGAAELPGLHLTDLLLELFRNQPQVYSVTIDLHPGDGLRQLLQEAGASIWQAKP